MKFVPQLCALFVYGACTTMAQPAPPAPPGPPIRPPPSSKDAFTLGNFTFLGSGCPEGTVSLVKSSEGDKISVLFSAYEAITEEGKRNVRKACNLAVPLDIKAGLQLTISKVDYRGYAYVPEVAGSSAVFQAEYFLAGLRGPKAKSTYGPGFDDDIELTDVAENRIATACGESTILRVNTNIKARVGKNDDGEQTEVSIDTIDQSYKNVFHFYIKAKTCS